MHPELTYAVLRQDGGGRVFIVAENRVEALFDVIGPAHRIAHILGPYFSVRLGTTVFDIAVVLSGSDLVGTQYIPLFSPVSGNLKTFTIIPASYVTPDSGTGLVHCAPAHGVEDYNAFSALGLISTSTNILCHVDGAGKFTEKISDVVGDSDGKTLVGQEVLNAGSRSMVQILQKIGALIKLETMRHRYPYDWKTNEPIIVTCVVHSLHCAVFTCFFMASGQHHNGLPTWTTSKITL